MSAEFFKTHKKAVIVSGAAVFILAAAALVLWRAGGLAFIFLSPNSAPSSSALPPVAATSPLSPPESPIPPPPTAAPLYQGEPVHIMSADPEVLKQIPVETYQKSKDELADLAVRLAQNPRRPEDWMRVAFIKRFYHDYAGARDAYEYLNRISDSDPIPFYNLGILYGYYLQEPEKAMIKYQAAIQRDAMNVSFYIGLADFYREVLKDWPSAEKILLQGMAKVPSDVNFAIALAGLYKAMGNIPKAVEYYEHALAGVLESGTRSAITAELERLKQILEAK